MNKLQIWLLVVAAPFVDFELLDLPYLELAELLGLYHS